MTPSTLPAFASFGEALTDLIRSGPTAWQAACGGAGWNVARAMSCLGVPSAFAGAISADVFGDALWDASQASGLDLRFLQRRDKSPLLAVVSETHPPRYFFIGDDSADLYFDASELPADWRSAVRYAHFGGISLAREPLASRLLVVAEDLKAAGTRISYDPNFRVLMDERYDVVFERMCRLADVIKVSDEDLQGLFRHPDCQAGLDRIRAWNPRALILLTRGAEGAQLISTDQAVSALPPPVAIVDTVGAGDASLAGLIRSLMHSPDAPLGEHLRMAVGAGAAACTVAGANLPSAAEVQALAAQVLAVKVLL